MVAKNKSTGASAEVGVIWTDAQGRMNFSPATAEDVEKSQGKKLEAGKAFNSSAEYFFNVYVNTPFKAKPAEGADIDF